MKRWSWVSFAAGIALAGGVVGSIWAVSAVQADQQQQYEACLADLGYYPDDPDVDLDGLIEASEACS